MKLKKIKVKPKKVVIDLILCPKTNLYLQSLYCRRCARFSKEDKKFIYCNYDNVSFSKEVTDRQKAKERILTEFQQTEVSQEKSVQNNNLKNSLKSNLKLTKTLEKSGYDEKDLKRVPVMDELKSKIDKNSLSDRLKDMNKYK